jgi:oxygen-independent coproporphyrinogen-3 oxidase
MQGTSVPTELLTKYDRPGPRYTSYPPATQFHAGVGAAEYALALESLEDGDPLAVYVHVPFCEHRCTYCGCHVIPTPKHSVSRAYVDRCLAELRLVCARLHGRPLLRSFHLGGGTPTYLSPGELRELIAAVRGAFEPAGDLEVSVELDPRVTTEAHLDALLAEGTNRVSLGVQDTSPEVQQAIGRFQTRDETVRFFALCRSKGFAGINVDLVYGLPHQTSERFLATLGEMLSLRPERFAIFGYAHVPWVKPNQEKIDASALPGAAARLELNTLAHRELAREGYVHIGFDHFALQSDELARAQREGALGRNFMGYTPHRGIRMIGLGISSIGEVGDGYFQNEKKLSTYYRAVDEGRFPIERGFLLSADDLARRWTIHEILCNLRLRYADFEARFHADFRETFAHECAAMDDFARDGLVDVDPLGIRVTERGVFLLRNIAMNFDRYLRERPPAQATYSRTV